MKYTKAHNGAVNRFVLGYVRIRVHPSFHIGSQCMDPINSVGDPTGNNNRAHQQLRRQAVSHDLALFIVTYFQQSLQVLHLQRCMSPMQPLHQKCEFKLLRQGLQNLFSVTPLILITKSILSQLTLLSQ